MLTLKNLKSTKGSNKNTKRIGRGQGSGWGTQAGKGDKGQKARSGGSTPLGFEGGQMPLYRRLPKRGFSNYPFKKEFAVLNLDRINDKFDDGATVSRETLIENGLLAGKNKKLPIKLLGNGELTKKFTFDGIEKFSASAKELVEKSGSTITETKE